ncbi:hypothetical protein ACWCOP_09390 [Maricaulaceae bacterium MS644]
MEAFFQGGDFWSDVLGDPAIGTWTRIVSWLFAGLWLWLIASLMRRGFVDLTEIIKSPYATPRERWDNRVRLPVRFAAIIAAAFAGAAGFSIGLFFQGAVVIFLWRQVSAG